MIRYLRGSLKGELKEKEEEETDDDDAQYWQKINNVIRSLPFFFFPLLELKKKINEFFD